MTTVVCRQLAPRVGEPAHNHQLILEAIATSGDADLLVLPELSSSGYVFRDAQEARSLALTSTSDAIGEWIGAVPEGMIVACGYAELGEDDRVYNSAMLFDRSGILANYRKVHLWDQEKRVFQAGQSAAPIVDTEWGRLGLMVCYDLEFPEYTRSAALRGADALVVPTNWPLVPRPDGERPPEVIIAQAAARTNKMPVICCDRSGAERGQDWTEGTTVIDHEGWVAGEADESGVARCELDLRAGRDKRVSEHNHLFDDRRPDLY
ncbi:putative amidohydrolase [Phycicoccus badiiscoriae]|uniref:Putative amidohydrolase n=1 Tax=Pedococcus badiiscoriae TaxID=642776 RepID=A0A852WDB8_9MICO|nr:nitrilase-related carbon-nitrogen hydrolase [Pedococcus badiiscoriae]NYG06779.1 putative amidohydrolase [Pedococcus badiiscoriae]